MEELNKQEIEKLRKLVLSSMNCKPEEFAKKYNAYKTAKIEFEEIFDTIKSSILLAHEENPNSPNTLLIGGVKLTYVSPSTRSTIDSKKLKEEEPELAKKFTKLSKVSASVRADGI